MRYGYTLHKSPDIERGDTKPNAEAMTKLARALDTTVDYLISGSLDQAAQEAGLSKELIGRFRKVENLGREEKKVVLSLLDAFIAKSQIQAIINI